MRIGLSQKDKVSRFRKRETVNLLSFGLNVGKSDKNIINLIKKKPLRKMEKQKENHAMGLPLGCPMNETAYILATSCPCPGGFELLEPCVVQTNLSYGVGNYVSR